MDATERALVIIGATVSLVSVLAGIWAYFSSATREAMMKRLTSDNEYLRGQLEFIEPRFRDAEAKNEMLMKLHNPTAKLDQMSATEAANHLEITRLLGEQHQALEEIKTEVAKPR